MQVIIHIHNLTNICLSTNKLSDFMVATKLFNLLINSGMVFSIQIIILGQKALSLPSLYMYLHVLCQRNRRRKQYY